MGKSLQKSLQSKDKPQLGNGGQDEGFVLSLRHDLTRMSLSDWPHCWEGKHIHAGF